VSSILRGPLHAERSALMANVAKNKASGSNDIPTQYMHMLTEFEPMAGAIKEKNKGPVNLHKLGAETQILPFRKSANSGTNPKDMRPISVMSAERKVTDTSDLMALQKIMDLYMNDDQ